jgi:chromosome segregation ATPase
VLKLSSNVSDVFPKVLKLSFEVSECKPLVIDEQRKALAEANEIIQGLARENEELKASTAAAGAGEGLEQKQKQEQKQKMIDINGQNFELRAQVAELMEKVHSLTRTGADAATAAAAGAANITAAEEVVKLRKQIEEMGAQQRDWDDAWKTGKEAGTSHAHVVDDAVTTSCDVT